jgi:thiamine-monophosphate kinase
MDVSDGLLFDAGRMADASGVTLDLDLVVLQTRAAELVAAAEALGDKDFALAWVLSGGEDHPLLATFAPDAELPAGYQVIGRVVERGTHGVILSGQPADDVARDLPTWDHFRG